MLDDIGYADWLKQTSTTETAAARRVENVDELLSVLTRLQDEDGKGRDLAQLLAHLTLMDIIERQDEEQGGDRVVLMTLHAAKGL